MKSEIQRAGINRRNARWRQNHPEYYQNIGNKYKDNPEYKWNQAEYQRRDEVKQRAWVARLNLKIEILSHYGLEGKLQCCWTGCEIDDIDLLTLDHLNNDGAKDRKGGDFYRKVRAAGFQALYQTLCWNHQWKKRSLLLKEKFKWQSEHF